MVKDVTLEEVEEAIKDAKTNKSPGMDGLSYELYKKCQNSLAPMLTEVINFQLSNDYLVPSNKIGATRLASKVADNVVPTLEELRPITLLNVDYRVMTRILSKRLSKVLPQVIKSVQSCAVEGSNICTSACNLLSFLEAVKKDGRKAAILSMDLFKA